MAHDKKFFELRVTGEENMFVAQDIFRKRCIVGYGIKETQKKDGSPCPVHAHYIFESTDTLVRSLREQFRKRGVIGNASYKIKTVDKLENYYNYTCKFYTFENLEYVYGIQYTVQFFEERRANWEAGFDIEKAGRGKKPDDMLEILCQGLDSNATREMIASNLIDYCRSHYKITRFWSDEKCRAVVKQVELHLKGHIPDFRDEVRNRWAY